MTDQTIILRTDVQHAIQGVVRYATKTGRYTVEVCDVLETLAIILGVANIIAWPALVTDDIIDAQIEPAAPKLAAEIPQPRVRQYRRVANG